MRRLVCITATVFLAFITLSSIPAMAHNDRISIDVRDADIVDVLRLLATESNTSILTDVSVRHDKVTLRLQNVTFANAMGALARAYNLQVHRENSILLIQGNSSSAQAIHLKYARSSDAIKHLKGLLADKSYSSDDKTNTILATGNSDALATTRSLLAAIDVPTPQVMFEVRVADIMRNNDTSNVGFLFGGLQNTSQTPQQFNYQFTPFVSKTIGLFTQLNAMVSHGNAKILATPRIATLNNQEASILIGTQYPVVTTTATSGGSNVNITYVDVGVKLRVTPTIGSDGSIVAELHPEVSTIDTIVQSAGASAPEISDRRIDTTLRIRKDETIVIGGLLRDIDSTTISKFPLLGDIPIFGELFRNRQKSRLKDDVVFLITPHIIP